MEDYTLFPLEKVKETGAIIAKKEEGELNVLKDL